MKKSNHLGINAVLLATVLPACAVAAETYGKGVDSIETDVLLLILYVLSALIFSFLCSVAEAVLLSITPSYIEVLKEERPEFAALLKNLKYDNIDRSLAAILTLNTIAHTMGAIGAGAKASVVFGSAWFGLFSGVMTLLILLLSEIVPKTIGAVYWSILTRPTAFFVKSLIVVLYPIVWISEKLTQFIAHGRVSHVFSRDEFIALTSAGVHTGQINSKESSIIRNLLQFESLSIVDIMTPRTVISALPENMKISDSLEKVSRSPFSRLPLYSGKIDSITGFVLKDDVLTCAALNRGEETLNNLKRDISAFPHSVSLTALLESFLRDRQHIAVIVDEHGGLDGLVTLEDLIETIMGMEIMDETDNVEDMRILARRKWLERARSMGLEVTLLDDGLTGTVKSQPSDGIREPIESGPVDSAGRSQENDFTETSVKG